MTGRIPLPLPKLLLLGAALLATAGVPFGAARGGDRVYDYDLRTYREIGSDNAISSGNQVRYFDYGTGTNQSYQIETQDRSDDGFSGRIFDPSTHQYRELDDQR